MRDKRQNLVESTIRYDKTGYPPSSVSKDIPTFRKT